MLLWLDLDFFAIQVVHVAYQHPVVIILKFVLLYLLGISPIVIKNQLESKYIGHYYYLSICQTGRPSCHLGITRFLAWLTMLCIKSAQVGS